MQSFFSPSLNKEIQKNIARKAVPLAHPSVRLEIENEIDAGDGRIETISAFGEQRMDEGNPNVQNISDTHRTKDDLEDDEVRKKKKEE